MKLENSFEVPASPEAAWALLMDVPRIIPCMPGAKLDETVDGSHWKDELGRPMLSVNPFGYPGNIYGSVAVPPTRVSRISSERPLAEVYSLVDLDQVAIPEDFVIWRSQLPKQPSHGRRRNYLYFDNHIGTEKVKDPGQL